MSNMSVALPEETPGRVQALQRHPEILFDDEPEREPGAEEEQEPRARDEGTELRARIDATRPFWVRRTDFAIQLAADLLLVVDERGSRLSGQVDVRRGFFELLGKRFDVARAQATVAVADFTLDIARGEFLVIVGPSGCGKTTVLNVLAGLEAPISGAVTIDGRPIRGPGPDRGVMFQDYALFPWHTVWGNVEFGLRHGPAGAGLDAEARRKRVASCIDLVGLSGSESKPASAAVSCADAGSA